MDVLKDLIFSGHVTKEVLIHDVAFIFTTLSKNDELEMDLLEKQKRTKLGNVQFIIKLLVKVIHSIGYIQFNKEALKELLEAFPLNFLLSLYVFYKDFTDSIIQEVNTNFVDFINSKESDVQWEVLKMGFLWPQPLTSLQETWIFYRKQLDENKEFEKYFNLSKYIISHITHAQLNPKSYINMIKQEKHQEEVKELKESGDYNDVTKQYFDKILGEKDKTKAKELFDKSIVEKDEHDLIFIEYYKDLFKKSIRNRRNVKHTIKNMKKPDIEVGYKQEVFFEKEQSKINSQFIRDNVNYEDIFKDSLFADLSMDIKIQLFDEVMNEEAELVQIKEKKKLVTDIPKKGKTLREIMQEKNMDGKSTMKDLGA
jgi:hypothetical protein